MKRLQRQKSVQWKARLLIMPHACDNITEKMNRALGLLCAHRLNWTRRTWGGWDDWDDTVLQTQDSKFELWRSEAEHATSRSWRLPIILIFTRGWGGDDFFFFLTAETGNRTRNSGVKTTTLGPPLHNIIEQVGHATSFLGLHCIQ